MKPETTQLQYCEVKEPKEIEYYQLFMRDPNATTVSERWFLCNHSTNYEYLKKQEKWWKEQGHEEKEFRIFSILLPYS